MKNKSNRFPATVVWSVKTGPAKVNVQHSEGFHDIKTARGFKKYLGKAFHIRARLVLGK